jgi:RNA polymerase sigma-70 factor (ECF subfamily)
MQVGGALPKADASGFPVVKQSSDPELIQSIARGDKDALGELFARHHVRVHRYLLRILGDRPAADDLVSDVFLAAWRDADKFAGRSQVATWLLAIARNLALSRLRRRSADGADVSEAEQIEDGAGDPEAALQNMQLSATIADCVKQLPQAHREIIILFYYRDKSIREVATAVGIPLSTVKTRMFYARSRMAKLLEHAGVDRTSLGRTAVFAGAQGWPPTAT